MLTEPTVPPPSETGYLEFRQHRTWYRFTRPSTGRADRLPIVILHGGPGVPHDYCLPMANLASDGRVVIHYDQVGCGRSSDLRNAEPSYLEVGLFVAELENLVRSFALGDGFHLLGQSWGGMLAVEYVLAHPQGVASLTVCNSPASMPLWRRAAERLRSELPGEILATMRRHEAAGSTDSDEYLRAVDLFYARHVCRVQPMPAYVAASFLKLGQDPTVYRTMNGPNEFHVIGTLRDWSAIDRLSSIHTPTLVIAGEFDEAASETWRPFVEGIPNAEWHVFARSSHMPHVEVPEEFLGTVGAFLRRHDGAGLFAVPTSGHVEASTLD